MGERRPEASAFLRWPRPLYALVAVGALLRLAIAWLAENRLASCESTVGVMALDVLEGRALPAFHYANAYNGGAALEAYLIAPAFAAVGPVALAAKLCLLALWTAAALLFADLCGRILTARAALLALLFFCIGTPFFLEWSLKARGGFAETVLFSIGLLWLAEPPLRLRKRLGVRCLLFGFTSGIALWASEMILLLIPFAAFWLVFRHTPRAQRARACALLAVGAGVGLLPLLVFNLTHDWSNLRASLLFALLTGARTSSPLGLVPLRLSARFVLGGAWPLLVLGIAVAGVRLWRRPLGLPQLLLAHALVYLGAFWISGDRYLSIPPSRVLYALYPGLAVLLGVAAEPPPGRVRRAVAFGAVAVWLVSVSVPVGRWVASGQPREAGSWRGSWALTDAEGLYQRLASENVRMAYVDIWAMESLSFAVRAAQHRDLSAHNILVTAWLPERPIDVGTAAAIVVHRGTRANLEVGLFLGEHSIPHRRAEWGDFVVFSGLPSAVLYRSSGLPPVLAENDWPDPPASPDGFN
jgi:hypothetical protein